MQPVVKAYFPPLFQHIDPLHSKPFGDVTWGQVTRVLTNARMVLSGLSQRKILSIAEEIQIGLYSFYNDCEYLRWMGYEVPPGTPLYQIHDPDHYPSPSECLFSDAEIIHGYCLKMESLKKEKPTQVFAVFALMKVDDMAGAYKTFKANPKRIIDLEMMAADLCDAMEALGAAYSLEHIRIMGERTKHMRTLIAKQAASGRTKKIAPFKKAVLERYTKGNYQNPNAAGTKIWEDVRNNPNNYPNCPLANSSGCATVIKWIRAEEKRLAGIKGKKTGKKR